MHKRFFTTPAALALLTAGLVGASWSAAWADPQTDGSGGAASGNQVNVPVDVEADLCGDSLAVLGISKAQCTEVAKVLYASSDEGGDAPATDGSGGVASATRSTCRSTPRWTSAATPRPSAGSPRPTAPRW